MNDYVLIKLNGNWIEKEQARGRISFLLEHVKNAKIMKNAVMRMSASQQIHRFELDAVTEEQATTYAKNGIANKFAQELITSPAMEFITTQNGEYIKFTGNIAVICDNTGSGDEDGKVR